MAKTYNFEGQLELDGSIKIPAEIVGLLPQGADVHVVVTLASNEENEDWRKWTAEGFFAAYDDRDVIYEELLNDPEPR